MSESHFCPKKNCSYEGGYVGLKVHHQKAHDESISGEEVNCTYCDDSFRLKRKRAQEQDHYFCPEGDCENQWRSENFSGEDNPFWKEKNKVNCEYCEGELELPDWRIEQGNGKFFCGGDSDCQSQWRSENFSGENNPQWEGNTVVCDWCGDTFERWKSAEEYHDRNFCDHKGCYAEWLSQHISGKDHPNWRGGVASPDYGPDWLEVREEILNRDGYECFRCGVSREDHLKDHEIGLDVHHIKPVDKFDSPDNANKHGNLITLCRDCHREWEGVEIRPTPETYTHPSTLSSRAV